MGAGDISDAIDLANPAPEQNQQKTDAGEQSVEQTEPRLDEKPNGGYGWICVLCLLSINAMTWGKNYRLRNQRGEQVLTCTTDRRKHHVWGFHVLLPREQLLSGNQNAVRLGRRLVCRYL